MFRARLEAIDSSRVRRRRWLLCCCAVICACGGVDASGADLTPPRVIAVDLPDGEAISPTRPIRLAFSEALAGSSISDNAIVIVPFLRGGLCSVDLGCDEGRCYGGRCQQDLIDAQWTKDMARPPLGKSRLQHAVPMRLELGEEGRTLILRVREPMDAHRLHSLVVGATLTDRRGNPLQHPPDYPLALRRIFATAGAEEGQPTMTLLSPPPGSTELPTNLSRLVVGFSKPVQLGADAAFLLEGEGGQRVGLSADDAAQGCAQTEPGSCLWLDLDDRLDPLEVWTLRVEGSVVDHRGQPLLEQPPPQIATGSRADEVVPAMPESRIEVAGGCAVLHIAAAEPVDVMGRPSWAAATVASNGKARHQIAMRVVPPLDGVLRLTVSDWAGNAAPALTLTIDADSFPPIAITEVLANPSGPEPDQEFVELHNWSNAPIALTGWTLDDGDDGVGVNTLPAVTLDARQYGVVVGQGFSVVAGADALPAPGALVIRLDSSIGSRGLANRGERLALRTERGQLVSTYGGDGAGDKASDEGRSVERLDPASCDVASAWRPNPQGRSTPGSAIDPASR